MADRKVARLGSFPLLFLSVLEDSYLHLELPISLALGTLSRHTHTLVELHVLRALCLLGLYPSHTGCAGSASVPAEPKELSSPAWFLGAWWRDRSSGAMAWGQKFAEMMPAKIEAMTVTTMLPTAKVNDSRTMLEYWLG